MDTLCEENDPLRIKYGKELKKDVRVQNARLTKITEAEA